jgi:fimbrial chaperone protein
MRLLAIAALWASLVAGPAIAAPQMQVSPVLIELPAAKPIAAFRMRNMSDAPAAFEASAFVWTQENGEDRLVPSTDLIISPPAMIVPAHGDQIVRVALKGAAGNSERAFRLLLSETPLADQQAEGGLHVRLEMSLPVFAAPRVSHPLPPVFEADAQAKKLRVANKGNRYMRLQPLVVAGGDNAPALPRYLLAGSALERVLPAHSANLRLSAVPAGANTAIKQEISIASPVVDVASR